MNKIALIFFLIIFNVGISDGASISKLKMSGISIANIIYPYSLFQVDSNFFIDNGYNVQKPSYLQTSQFARALFTTTATKVDIYMANNMYQYYANGYCGVGIRVDGVDLQTANCTSTSPNITQVTLSAGSKIVEFINGIQEIRSGVIDGAFITKVIFEDDSAAVKYTPTPSKRIVIYGDSISSGFLNLTPTLTGWPMLLRSYYGPTGSVVTESFGNRYLHDDAATAGTQTSFGQFLAAYFSGYSTKILYISIGYNDYAGSAWSATNFGIAYAALLDAVHAADSGVIVYAQTPIVASNESTNSFGNNLGAYRTSAANACNARSSYCTTFDGTTILTTSDLGDGKHPAATAQNKYYMAVKTELGI